MEGGQGKTDEPHVAGIPRACDRRSFIPVRTEAQAFGTPEGSAVCVNISVC